MVRLALALSTVTVLALGGLPPLPAPPTSSRIARCSPPGAEVPKPKAATGAGGLFASSVTKDGTSYSISWKLTYRKLSGPAVAAHVHRGRVGVAGGVILALCGPCRSGQTGTAKVTKAVARGDAQGTAYVNVHTTKNPAGEIRGQAKLTRTGRDRRAAAASTDPTPPPPPYDPY